MTPTSVPTRLSAWLEQAWLMRYLDRELDSSEAAWFEAYVLDKPELVTMIDADTHLRDALAAESNAGGNDASTGQDRRLDRPNEQPIEGVANTKNDASTKRATQFSGRRVLPPWLAVAAALVLGLGVGGLGMRALAPNQNAALIASPTRIIYDTMRGEATAPRIEHADSDSDYVLVEVAVPPGAEDIILLLEGIDRSAKPGPDGFVSYLIKRESLTSTHHMQLTYNNGSSHEIRSLSVQVIERTEGK